MPPFAISRSSHTEAFVNPTVRLRWLAGFMALGFIAIIVRLGYLQIYEHKTYETLASGQHDLEAKLLPVRGRVYVRDSVDRKLYPLAANRDAWVIYAVPKDIKDPIAMAHELAPILQVPDVDLITRLNKPGDPFEPLLKNATTPLVETLKEKKLKGIGYVKTSARLYPEKGVSGQLIGFVVNEENRLTGKYGVEGSFDELLAGKPGTLFAKKDASGGRLAIGETSITEAVNGPDLVLTIDRTIQYETCIRIKEAVEKHQADGGSILIMDPNTGAIMAMCSYPDFDPSQYSKADNMSVYNNPVIFSAYEPGSTFKAVTLAAGLDAEKISPKTTYNDTGLERIDNQDVQNSDKKAHGIQTMTQVLDESLNTGTIFVQRLLGKEAFRKAVESFGFGKKTGIELSPEGKGNISSLNKKGDIWAATASYGQGITVTPIQLLAAYGALANGGKLMRPFIVAETIYPDGRVEKTRPTVMGRPIEQRASRLISGMLVSAVENGHGKLAGVPGFWVAGKTGTAQIARTDGPGYEKDASIGSFAGYAPASDPRFVMLVKIDRPRDVVWAESSAAPLFGKMAKFLLTYLQIPPERPIKEATRAMSPASPAASPATSTRTVWPAAATGTGI